MRSPVQFDRPLCSPPSETADNSPENSLNISSDFKKYESTNSFGKFIVKEKKSRRGRNPETGDDFILDARRVVTFKCSKNLREKLNVEKKKRKKL